METKEKTSKHIQRLQTIKKHTTIKFCQNLEERWHYQQRKNIPNLNKLPVNEITVDQDVGMRMYFSLRLFNIYLGGPVKDWKDTIRQ
jgi:hypothetical protein